MKSRKPGSLACHGRLLAWLGGATDGSCSAFGGLWFSTAGSRNCGLPGRWQQPRLMLWGWLCTSYLIHPSWVGRWQDGEPSIQGSLLSAAPGHMSTSTSTSTRCKTFLTFAAVVLASTASKSESRLCLPAPPPR